jgi:hypothetical protein
LARKINLIYFFEFTIVIRPKIIKNLLTTL